MGSIRVYQEHLLGRTRALVDLMKETVDQDLILDLPAQFECIATDMAVTMRKLIERIHGPERPVFIPAETADAPNADVEGALSGRIDDYQEWLAVAVADDYLLRKSISGMYAFPDDSGSTVTLLEICHALVHARFCDTGYYYVLDDPHRGNAFVGHPVTLTFGPMPRGVFRKNERRDPMDRRAHRIYIADYVAGAETLATTPEDELGFYASQSGKTPVVWSAMGGLLDHAAKKMRYENVEPLTRGSKALTRLATSLATPQSSTWQKGWMLTGKPVVQLERQP